MMAVHHSRCRSLPYSKAATHHAGESQLLRLYTLMLPPTPPRPPLLQRDPLKDDANKTRLSKKKKRRASALTHTCEHSRLQMRPVNTHTRACGSSSVYKLPWIFSVAAGLANVMWGGGIESLCSSNLPDSHTRGLVAMEAPCLFSCPCFGFHVAGSPSSSHPFCLYPSEHQNHARELVKKADLSQWDALVIMSGDGLLFEVLSLSQDGQ